QGACTHCHQDVHKGTVGTECVRCHTTDAWKPSTFDRARHASTRFPLDGKHVDVRCANCHAGGQLKDLPLDCQGCHIDRHQGRFGEDCASCHKVTGFKPVTNFDHVARTGFPLVGVHQQAKCEACHEGRVQDVIDRGPKPLVCASCHGLGHGEELGT